MILLGSKRWYCCLFLNVLVKKNLLSLGCITLPDKKKGGDTPSKKSKQPEKLDKQRESWPQAFMKKKNLPDR